MDREIKNNSKKFDVTFNDMKFTVYLTNDLSLLEYKKNNIHYENYVLTTEILPTMDKISR